jgi:hypothetical protein
MAEWQGKTLFGLVSNTQRQKAAFSVRFSQHQALQFAYGTKIATNQPWLA